MTNSDPSPSEIQRRFAAVERRISKLEMGMSEIDPVIDLQGLDRRGIRDDGSPSGSQA